MSKLTIRRKADDIIILTQSKKRVAVRCFSQLWHVSRLIPSRMEFSPAPSKKPSQRPGVSLEELGAQCSPSPSLFSYHLILESHDDVRDLEDSHCLSACPKTVHCLSFSLPALRLPFSLFKPFASTFFHSPQIR